MVYERGTSLQQAQTFITLRDAQALTSGKSNKSSPPIRTSVINF
jgi:hypothetical protein